MTKLTEIIHAVLPKTERGNDPNDNRDIPGYLDNLEIKGEQALRFKLLTDDDLAALPALNLDGVHWLIAGGESQSGARSARRRGSQTCAISVRRQASRSF